MMISTVIHDSGGNIINTIKKFHSRKKLNLSNSSSIRGLTLLLLLLTTLLIGFSFIDSVLAAPVVGINDISGYSYTSDCVSYNSKYNAYYSYSFCGANVVETISLFPLEDSSCSSSRLLTLVYEGKICEATPTEEYGSFNIITTSITATPYSAEGLKRLTVACSSNSNWVYGVSQTIAQPTGCSEFNIESITSCPVRYIGINAESTPEQKLQIPMGGFLSASCVSSNPTTISTTSSPPNYFLAPIDYSIETSCERSSNPPTFQCPLAVYTTTPTFVRVEEEDPFVNINFTLFYVASAPQTITCETVDDSAVANVDFVPVITQFTLPTSSDPVTISIPLIDNERPEFEKSFQLKCSNSKKDHITSIKSYYGPDSETSYITIRSSDSSIGRFSFESPTLTAEEYGYYIINVIRSGPISERVEIPFEVYDGSAVSPDDYQLISSNTVVFESGDAFQTILFWMGGVNENEDKYFSLWLNPPDPAAIGDNTNLRITILDKDIYSSLEFSGFGGRDSKFTTPDDSRNFLIVQRLGSTDYPLSVDWQISNDIYTNESALFTYKEISGTLYFEIGITELYIVLDVPRNDSVQPSKYFTLSLVSLIGKANIDSPDLTLVVPAHDYTYLFTFSPFSTSIDPDNSLTIQVTMTGELTAESFDIDWRAVSIDTAIADVDFTPISGTLTFTIENNAQSFELRLPAMTDPSIDRVFAVELVNLPDNSLVDTPGQSKVTINYHGDPYGIFSFTTYSLTIEEGSSESLTIQRTGSTDGYVTAFLEIGVGSGLSAPSDVLTFSRSSVIFAPGETEQSVDVNIIDNEIPQQNQYLTIFLSSLSTKYATKTYPSEIYLTIPENDHIFGSFIVTYSASATQAYVNEGDMLTLTVQRVGGIPNSWYYGNITVNLKTTTTLLEGVTPATKDIDYVDRTYQVQFEYTDIIKEISVETIDNEDPSGYNWFAVEIESIEHSIDTSSPPIVGVPSLVDIAINPSDGGNGGFAFNPSQLVLPVDSGNTTITVTRAGLNAGVCMVNFATAILSKREEQAFTYTTQALFQERQETAEFTIFMTPTTDPFFTRYFYIAMNSNCTAATYGNILEVKIPPANYPAGFISFPETEVTIPEDTVNYTAVITRTGGTLLKLIVSVTIDYYNNGEETNTTTNINLTFEQGDTAQTLDLEFSRTPEPYNRWFVLTITGVEKYGGTDPEPTLKPTIGNNELEIRLPTLSVEATGTFSIDEDSLTISATEGGSSVAVRVVRTGGSQGDVKVTLGLVENDDDNAAQEGSDFTFDGSLSLDFADGETEKDLIISIVDDDDPEVAEFFQIQIVCLNTTVGTHIGDLNVSSITIGPSDKPIGEFSWETSTQYTEETGAILSLTITRSFGSFYSVALTVDYDITTLESSGFAMASAEDFTLSNPETPRRRTAIGGPITVYFANSQTSAKVNVLIKADGIPEEDEVFEVVIAEATPLFSVPVAYKDDPQYQPFLSSTDARARITIFANEYGNGIFDFESSSDLQVSESHAIYSTGLVRTGGSFGKVGVLVSYSTGGFDFPATSSVDFVLLTSMVYFEDGETLQLVNFSVPVDLVPEVTEYGRLTISGVVDARTGLSEPFGFSATVGSTAPTRIIIVEENENPHGEFTFTGSSSVSVNPREQETVDLTIIRTGGSFDEVDVFVSTYTGRIVGPTPASEGVDFIGLSEALVHFDDGQTEATVTVRLSYDDDIPHGALLFEIQIDSVECSSATAAPPTVGGFDRINITVVPYGDNPGTFDFAVAEANLTTGSEYELTIYRTGGSYGAVNIRVNFDTSGEANPIPISEVPMFESGFIDVQFEQSQTEATVVIKTSFSAEPSVDRGASLLLSIESSTYSGASIGVGSTFHLVILAHDDPHGIVGFETTSISTEEGATIEVTVVRNGGLIGDIVIEYTVIDGGVDGVESTSESDYSGTFDPLTIPAGVSSGSISITISEDDVDELAEGFTIQLVSVTALVPSGSEPRIDDSSSKVEITIASNGYASGEFSIDEDSLTISATEGGSSVAVRVVRTGGSQGDVKVTLGLVENDDDNAAQEGSDFTFDGSLSLDFADGETEKDLIISIVDDDDPEVAEFFQIQIVCLNTTVGTHIGDLNVSSITIGPSDKPIGEFSWETSTQYTEETGAILSLTITRSFGSFYSVALTVDYDITTLESSGFAMASAEDFTLSNPETPRRRTAIGGPITVYFANSQTSAKVNVLIKADGIPEEDEVFEVVIAEATPLFSVPVAYKDDPQYQPFLSSTDARARITIFANEYGNGIFDFESSSDLQVSESHAIYSTGLVRTGGSFGKVGVLVSYSTGGFDFPATSSVDFVLLTSMVYFEDGETLQLVNFSVPVDLVPEVTEYGRLTISGVVDARTGLSEPFGFSATVGSTAPTRIIIVEENENPHGEFTFTGSSSVSVNPREQETVDLTIIRTGGSFDEVDVFVSTYTGRIVGPTPASEGVDFIGLSEALVHFDDGQTEATVTVRLSYDDDIPHGALLFEIQIDSVECSSATAAPPTVGGFDRINITVVPYGDNPGTFDFAVAEANLTTGSEYELTIYRTGGSYGAVNIRVNFDTSGEANPIPISEVPMFESGFIDVQFEQSQTEATVVIKTSFSAEPSVDRGASLLLSIESSTYSGASIGVGSTFHLVILAHDDPNGVFQFAVTSASVNSNVGKYSLVVTRTGGLLQSVVLAGTASISGVTYPLDLSQDVLLSTPLSFTFAEGVSQVAADIVVVNHKIPRVDSSAVITLSIVSGGVYARLGSQTSFTLTVLAHDNPHGVVEFAADSRSVVVASASTPTTVKLNITRTGGSIGAIQVFFSSQTGTVAGVDSAEPGVDFVAVPGGTFVTLGNGVTSGFLSVSILHNSAPRLDNAFQVVVLGNVTLVGMTGTGSSPSAGSFNTSTITIPAHDDPNGVFQFAVTSASVNSNVGKYSLVVTRTGGLLQSVVLAGTASISGVTYPLDLSQDVLLSTPLSFTFAEGVSQVAADIVVVNHKIPRVDSSAVITLSIVSGGVYARLGSQTSFTLTVLAHDNPHGVVEFAADSRSVVVASASTPTTVKLNITRTGGSIGAIQVFYSTLVGRLDLQSSVPDVDFVPVVNGVLTINSGSFSGFASINVLKNDEPSFTSVFEVLITSVVVVGFQGSGSLPSVGSFNDSVVTIPAHHNPSGVFSVISSSSLVFAQPPNEPTPFTSIPGLQSGVIQIFVSRSGVAVDTANITWAVTSGLASLISPSSGFIVFNAGVTTRTIMFTVNERVGPQLASSLVISLTASLPVATSLVNASFSSSVVVITGSGDPFGVFSLGTSSILVSDTNSSSVVSVPVTRSGGSFEDIVINWGTTSDTRRAVDLRPAVDGVDFAAVSAGTLLFKAGQTTGFLNVTILSTDLPRLAVGFTVKINSVSRAGEVSSVVPTPVGQVSLWDGPVSPRLGSTLSALVSIQARNSPVGIFAFETTRVSVAPSPSAVKNVTFTVKRFGGSNGRVNIGVSSFSDSATLDVDFSLASPVITFEEGVTSFDLTVSVLPFSDKASQAVSLYLTILSTFIDNKLVSAPDPVALLGTPSTATLQILLIGTPRFCPTENLNNITWPATAAGVLVIEPCIFGYIGNVTRFCSSVGIWQEPNATVCISVEDLLAEALNATLTAANMESISGILSSMGPQIGALSVNSLGLLSGLLGRMNDVGDEFGFTDQTAANILNVYDSIIGSPNKTTILQHQLMADSSENFANVFTEFGYALLGENSTAGSTVKLSGSVSVLQAVSVSIDSSTGAGFSSEASSLTLPASLFETLNDQNVQALFSVSFELYPTSEMFPAVNQTGSILSNVIAGSVQDRPVYNLTDPVIFIMAHLASPLTPKCTYYDFHVHQWSSDGCATTAINSTHTQCACTHLTHFGVFFSLDSDAISEANADALSYISYIGCALSIAGAAITFISFCILSSLRTFAMKLVMHLCVSIFSLNIVFLSGIDNTGNSDACKAAGIFLHFFLLCMFCWMLCIGVNLYLGIVRLNTDTHIFYKYMIAFSYAVPALIVIITMAVDIDNYGGTTTCWINSKDALIGSFYVPILVVLVLNMIIFVSIVLAFRRATKDRRLLGQEERSNFRVMVIIFTMLGITWVFGVLALDKATLTFQYLFVIFNSFQGFFVFVFYCCNKRVFSAYKSVLGGRFPFSYISSIANRTSQTSAPGSTASTTGSVGRSGGTRYSSTGTNYNSTSSTGSRPTSVASRPVSSYVSSQGDDVEAGPSGTFNSSASATSASSSSSSSSHSHSHAKKAARNQSTPAIVNSPFVIQSEISGTSLRHHLEMEMKNIASANASIASTSSSSTDRSSTIVPLSTTATAASSSSSSAPPPSSSVTSTSTTTMTSTVPPPRRSGEMTQTRPRPPALVLNVVQKLDDTDESRP